jgi:hypothetical protein
VGPQRPQLRLLGDSRSGEEFFPSSTLGGGAAAVSSVVADLSVSSILFESFVAVIFFRT